MSNRLLNEAWRAECRSPAAKLVLLRLADRANDKQGGTCFPSIEGIATDCGLDERTVQRAIAANVAGGHITVVRSKGGYKRDRDSLNNYRVHPRHFATPGNVPPVAENPATPGVMPPEGVAICPSTPGVMPPKPKGTQIKPKENRKLSSFFSSVSREGRRPQ